MFYIVVLHSKPGTSHVVLAHHLFYVFCINDSDGTGVVLQYIRAVSGMIVERIETTCRIKGMERFRVGYVMGCS